MMLFFGVFAFANPETTGIVAQKNSTARIDP